MGAASGEQCRGACSEVLLEEIKEAAPGLVRDGGVVRVERLVDADRLEALVFRRLVGVGLGRLVHEPVADLSFVHLDGIVLVARVRKLLLELRGRGWVREAPEQV